MKTKEKDDGFENEYCKNCKVNKAIWIDFEHFYCTIECKEAFEGKPTELSMEDRKKVVLGLVLIEKKKIESSLLEVLEKARELDYYALRSLSVKMDKINTKLKN